MSADAQHWGRPTTDNPLDDIEPSQLEADVKAFHSHLSLDTVVDLRTLINGARLAKHRLRNVPSGLTPAELETISRESSEKYLSFLQTRGLLVTVMATACAAITQGWQQSTINSSALLKWQDDLGLDTGRDRLLIGFINAAPWLSGSLIGTWLSDPLQERFGRRPALFLSAIFCVAVEQLTALHGRHYWPVEYFLVWGGIFLGFFCALIVMDSWRVLLATAIIPAIVLLFLVFMCPESPRFLIQRNKYADAYKSLLELRGTPIQAARDLYYIHAQLQTEAIKIWHPHEDKSWWSEREQIYAYQSWINRGNFFQRMMCLATNPRTRRACMVALIVMASQQLCGINVLAFYSSELLRTNQSNPSDALLTPPMAVKWYNFGFGLANFLFTLPAYIFIDSRGRRPLLLGSFLGMFLSLIAVSGFFKIEAHYTRLILVAVFSCLPFVFCYSIGAGPIPFTLSAEVFPLCVREVGMSFSVMVNFLGLGLLVLFVPQLTSKFHGEGNLLFFFSGLNLLALILIFFFVPETKDVSLEDMNSICKSVEQRKNMFGTT
ncbi:hypothetical protein PENPOL_c002G03242 [Penicillium polonicum]|uniref:Major facilitator superfamily (MFS) profile domain-containing protein n=1 Tax=Penicillium polonicum TaxID=60169 RepID=A0A1V6NY11_PENPO|nr:hypothetical protein PENPOL_c002G03242 [Penicillium polonicum]